MDEMYTLLDGFDYTCFERPGKVFLVSACLLLSTVVADFLPDLLSVLLST
jgi:hypothetical protein